MSGKVGPLGIANKWPPSYSGLSAALLLKHGVLSVSHMPRQAKSEQTEIFALLHALFVWHLLCVPHGF